MLEVARRQLEQVFKHLTTEYCINTVASVQDQVLPCPRQSCGEQQEHNETCADDIQGAHGLVHDDLVDDDLGEYGRGKCQHLDDE